MDTEKEIGSGPKGVVRRWKLELELADKQEKTWRKDAERTIKRYRGEDYRTDSTDGGSDIKRNAFNILWSNTETLRPALYNSTPNPRVRRRFRDKDDIGKAVSEVLERSLSYSVDAYDFDRVMMMAVDDYLLPGRAVTRVRYVPTFEGEEEAESLAYEEVTCEHVNWADFRRGPGRTWDEVMWIAFRHKMTRKQLEAMFEKGGEIKLNLSVRDDNSEKQDDTDKTVFNRAEVWEIWDKEKRQVIFMSREETEPLREEDDPLNLDGFYPVPRPLYAMESSTSLVPVPEYHLYETLAKELDRVTARIMKILDGLRLRGIYDSTLAELDRLFDAGDNAMIPAENLAKFLSMSKGLDDAIWLLPIEKFAEVLKYLYEYRGALIQSIYEITGVSDILRGRSEPNETARAQQIKSNWGTLRIQRRQREVQRYARDIIRLKGELIAENFQIETLQAMTGLEYPTMEQKQQAASMLQAFQQRIQQIQQLSPGQEVELPDAMKQGMEAAQNVLSQPSWEEIKQTMGSDLMRNFKVEIETDSTIAEQMTEEKQDVVAMLRGLVEFSNGVGPAVQAGLLPPKAIKALLLASVRRFKLGEEVEDAIEEAEVQEGNNGPSPEEQQAQVDMMKMKFDAELAKKEHEWNIEKMRMEMEISKQKHAMEMQKMQAKVQGQIAVEGAQAEGDVIKGAMQ